MGVGYNMSILQINKAKYMYDCGIS